MKTCTKCGFTKNIDLFSNDKSRKDGKFPQCKDCSRAADKARQPKEKERRNKVSKEWRLANPERSQALINAWHEKHPEKRNQAVSNFYKRNPDKGAAKTAKYRAIKKQAIPPWFEESKVELLYKKAEQWGMEVDHVVPLRGKNVCGLHCWSNLQLLDRSTNAIKNNRDYPDH